MLLDENMSQMTSAIIDIGHTITMYKIGLSNLWALGCLLPVLFCFSFEDESIWSVYHAQKQTVLINFIITSNKSFAFYKQQQPWPTVHKTHLFSWIYVCVCFRFKWTTSNEWILIFIPNVFGWLSVFLCSRALSHCPNHWNNNNRFQHSKLSSTNINLPNKCKFIFKQTISGNVWAFERENLVVHDFLTTFKLYQVCHKTEWKWKNRQCLDCLQNIQPAKYL